MREESGDLFDYPADAIVIPINWRVNRRGQAIMGAGVALAAAKRWAWLPSSLGHQIERGGPSVVCFQASMEDGRLVYLLLAPTKHDWRDPSTVGLVELAATTLSGMVDRHGWQTIALPRLGCGLGGLEWETQVRPVLAERLDDRFVVVTPEAAR